jgi:hypothetical protein
VVHKSLLNDIKNKLGDIYSSIVNAIGRFKGFKEEKDKQELLKCILKKMGDKKMIPNKKYVDLGDGSCLVLSYLTFFA